VMMMMTDLEVINTFYSSDNDRNTDGQTAHARVNF